MPSEVTGSNYQWLCAGREIFPAMLAAIEGATQSVCLETYIYAAGGVGDRFLEAMVRARQRGVGVRVLVDALGSMSLPWSYWKPLLEAGARSSSLTRSP